MSVIGDKFIDIPLNTEKNVCGHDSYLKKIERTFHVTMIVVDMPLKMSALEQMAAEAAKSAFNNLDRAVGVEMRSRAECDYAPRPSFGERWTDFGD